MHCVYLALWTCKVLCGSYLCAIYKFSFIHSFRKIFAWALFYDLSLLQLPIIHTHTMFNNTGKMKNSLVIVAGLANKQTNNKKQQQNQSWLPVLWKKVKIHKWLKKKRKTKQLISIRQTKMCTFSEREMTLLSRNEQTHTAQTNDERNVTYLEILLPPPPSQIPHRE